MKALFQRISNEIAKDVPFAVNIVGMSFDEVCNIHDHMAQEGANSFEGIANYHECDDCDDAILPYNQYKMLCVDDYGDIVFLDQAPISVSNSDYHPAIFNKDD